MNTQNQNTQNQNTVNNKIQDFGQKIGGARKDIARAAMDLAAVLAGVTTDSLKALQLSKVAKFAQIEKLAQAGAISAETARACFALWRTIETKPATSYRVSRWAENTAAKLAQIAALIGGAAVSDEVRALPDFRVLTAANYPAQGFSFGRYSVCDYSPNHYSFLARVQHSDGLAVIAGHYYQMKATEGTAEENARRCADFIREHQEEQKQQRKEGATFELWKCGAVWYAAPKGRNKIHVKEWSTREAAAEGMKDTAALREAWDKIRNTPELRRTTNRARIGEDYRQGVDITPEKFAEAFPFRGVEFGNWLTQADRLTRLNETFDSLRDLCKLCGINAEAVTLKSWLAMAFGSRGIPGAAAHFEHSHQVINLTKEHGAGSLAHEWFHALDAFTASRLGGGFGMMAVKDYASMPEGEERQAARALYLALYKSNFARRSELLDYYKNKSYYGTITEMGARAFECYVIELAKIHGYCIDFLANVTTAEEWRAGYGSLDCYPYPTPEEVAELAPAFGRFLRVCCDAEELSKDAAQLFEEGRQKMEAQRAEEQQQRAQAMEEQKAAREVVREQKRQEMAEKVAAITAECGAVWSFLFESCEWYACIGGAGFIGIVYPSGATAWRTVEENRRIRNAVRGKWGRILEVRPGVNLEEFARKDLANGFNMFSEIAKAWKNTYAESWEEFAGRNAEALQKAQDAQNRAQELAKVAEAETVHTETEKATEAKESAKDETAAAQVLATREADGLQLVEIAGGVAVVETRRNATFKHRKEIRANGGDWNKPAKQWQALNAQDIQKLRQWFGLSESTEPQAETVEEVAAPTPSNETAEGAARYSVCDNSQNQEADARRCYLYSFTDIEREPHRATSFANHDEGSEWLKRAANGTGALNPKGIEVLEQSDSWLIWYAKNGNLYCCDYLAESDENARQEWPLETMRDHLQKCRRQHIAKREGLEIDTVSDGEAYRLNAATGQAISITKDQKNPGAYVVEWFEDGEMEERHTNQSRQEAAESAALFVCGYMDAQEWRRWRVRLKVDRIEPIKHQEPSPTPSDSSAAGATCYSDAEKSQNQEAATPAPDDVELSPIMKQYYQLRAKHPDAVLLFRCGDYYETYSDNAQKVADILGLTLTQSSLSRDRGGERLKECGFHYSHLDEYLPHMIRAGVRVAILRPAGTAANHTTAEV